MANYSINISLDNGTLNFFAQNDYWLRIYKGELTNAVCVNTLWHTTNIFTSSVSVSWTDDYAGFICPQIPLNKGAYIRASVTPMQLGDVLSMNSSGIASLTTKGGTAGALTFFNNSHYARICGAAQSITGTNQLYMAMPMLGQGNNVVVPQENVLLVFESGEMAPGTVVSRAINPSLLAKLNPGSPIINITYDYLNSWNTNGSTQASVIPGPAAITDQLRKQHNPLLRQIKKLR
ncbi:hypothetical protein [Mucilaginibacter ginsenosidivorans]|uniref:Uncharacterized protein n=1 Tax=Mucilaginibacter ginsenosidivorans TaxID=398053 RepID=A0A5B8V0S6_9SPHI|nr:hypothetical protein [Mucilaginibacter ginsenosidivorans]QEC64809.1 hypothetical protein FRZ54_20310 [Mucilaginibacter ginsenosidivorans]